MKLVITPKVGLDNIKFGMFRTDVEKILGPPEQITTDESHNDSFIIWYYWSKRVSFSFDSEVDFRLTTIEMFNPEATLYGISIIGMTEDEAQKVLFSNGHKNPVISDESQDEFNWKLMDYEDSDLNVWFEDGVVNSVQWGVNIDENDQECWP